MPQNNSVKLVLFWHQELTEDLRRLTKDIKAMGIENESLSQQLKESLAKLDALSQTQPDVNNRQHLLGTMLEEKFNLEKKVMYSHFFECAVDFVKPENKLPFKVELLLVNSGQKNCDDRYSDIVGMLPTWDCGFYNRGNISIFSFS